MTAARSVRRATVTDARPIAEIQVRAHQWAYRGLMPDAHLARLSADEREPVWRPQLAPDSPTHVFVVEEEGRLLGFVAGGPSRDADATAAIGEVYAIYQEPDAAGTGVGGSLMQRALADLQARGFEMATLWVLDTNERGRRFYERGGWQLDGASKVETRSDHVRTELRYRRST